MFSLQTMLTSQSNISQHLLCSGFYIFSPWFLFQLWPLEVCPLAGKLRACIQILPMWHLIFVAERRNVVTWSSSLSISSNSRLLMILWVPSICVPTRWIYSVCLSPTQFVIVFGSWDQQPYLGPFCAESSNSQIKSLQTLCLFRGIATSSFQFSRCRKSPGN